MPPSGVYIVIVELNLTSLVIQNAKFPFLRSLNMFLDSECYSCCIVLICFILSHYAISESLRASNITRGSRDRFANPMCEPPAVKGSCKCDNLGASCIVDNCPVCRCNTKNTTFSPVDGKCVDNDKFAFLIGKFIKPLC